MAWDDARTGSRAPSMWKFTRLTLLAEDQLENGFVCVVSAPKPPLQSLPQKNSKVGLVRRKTLVTAEVFV